MGPALSSLGKSQGDNEKGLQGTTLHLHNSHSGGTSMPDPRPLAESSAFSFPSEGGPAAWFHLIVYFYLLVVCGQMPVGSQCPFPSVQARKCTCHSSTRFAGLLTYFKN